ncbi:MAG: RagB/SusD family nutrient uptake outer membrane protein [Flavobacteriaceae bacterium]|nr:RagB/SusD family nutrient uptake outer membrane protein [Flavobacteriaceae bacterium]
MNNIFKYSLLSVVMLFLASCSDFLDVTPDDRTTLDSKENIRKSLTSAYPQTSFATFAELSSDNVCDQGDDDPYFKPISLEFAYWEDATQVSLDDTKSFWQACYAAITSSNLALEQIEKMKGEDLKAEKAEALMTRAFSHFLLVNVFARHYNPETADKDLGIPYMLKPEKELNPKYKRGTVAEVYEKINKDIEEALPYISDDIYEQPKYHFSLKASYAFAARFNLYYGKWEKAREYASKALESSRLINWEYIGNYKDGDVDIRSKQLVKDDGCLLLQTDNSEIGLLFGPYNLYTRVNHTVFLGSKETAGSAMPWGNIGYTSSKCPYIMYPDKRVLFPYAGYYFEFTDEIAQIGMAKTVFGAFTSDETLLIRAETNIILGNNEEALADINKWARNFYRTESLDRDVTLDEVNKFYDSMKYSASDPNTLSQKKELHPMQFTIKNKTQENMLHFVLQCRRLLTLHSGLRWFDVKRYGIEVHRFKKINNSYQFQKSLPVGDARRAIQIPQDVISSGLTANPR